MNSSADSVMSRDEFLELKSQVAHLQEAVGDLKMMSVGQKVWDVMMKAAVPIALAAGAMVLTNKDKNTGQDAKLESLMDSRFTSQDGYELERRMQAEMRTFVAESEARFAKALSQMPPIWLTDMVQEVRDGQKEIKERLIIVETTVRNVNENKKD